MSKDIFNNTPLTVDDVRKLGEEEKLKAAKLISKHIFKQAPETTYLFPSPVSKAIVDAIVNASILEITALQKQATSKIG